LSLLRLLPESLLRLLPLLVLGLGSLLRGDSLGGLEGAGLEGLGGVGGASLLGVSTFGLRSSWAGDTVAAAAPTAKTDASVTKLSLAFAKLNLMLRPPYVGL
jgi:hypothetical protein